MLVDREQGAIFLLLTDGSRFAQANKQRKRICSGTGTCLLTLSPAQPCLTFHQRYLDWRCLRLDSKRHQYLFICYELA